MPDIINLRRARKTRLRAADEAQAGENRAKFGRPKAERERIAAQARIREGHIEGHRLKPRDEP